MSFIGWIVFGAISGFIASMVVERHGKGLLRNVALGVAGAILGGWLFAAAGSVGIGGFDLYSMFAAVIGAVVALSIHYALIKLRA